MLYCPHMPKEHGDRYQPPEEVFGLTEREKLWDRISDERFQTILSDPDTTIHQIELASNSFGEYLFISLSREANGQRAALVFWGLGFHEQREHWITDHWRWYSKQARYLPDRTLPLTTAQSIIQERREEIAPQITTEAPSERAQLFTILADLGDEDGALAEMQDLERWMGGFFGATEDDVKE